MVEFSGAVTYIHFVMNRAGLGILCGINTWIFVDYRLTEHIIDRSAFTCPLFSVQYLEDGFSWFF